ncbi:MAG: 4-hydroxythreonine-4-phosphate dehydrogenase PdxA [Candidatus Methylacidiphilales bacterium]|nr:4-hydroxythreonine-4-phosphate dehydrogenase PdxA [Candidatus Methylacidiphilales bacterium]
MTPTLGLTLGDPSGIGPEIIDRALPEFEREFAGIRVRLIGSASGVRPGRPTLRSARLALGALDESVRLLRTGEIAAVVNGPVHKAWLMRVGFRFPGQTEFYAARAGLKPSDVTMLMASPRLNVALATTHLPLRRAVAGLRSVMITDAARRVALFLREAGVARPRLAVCGLNPHAGEEGAFGDEERTVIAPALRSLKKIRWLRIEGPAVPDAVFRSALQGRYDAVVALYHDQGLIPFKLASFEDGVNVTLGLPFLRCAPDHGTGHDIAGKGLASPASLLSALRLAGRWLGNQRTVDRGRKSDTLFRRSQSRP